MIFGQTFGLKSSEIKSLERLSSYRTSAKDIINPELAKKASLLASTLGRHIALLIKRDGKVFKVVLGDSNIVYLPDLGRFRLSKARLRRLRLLVFLPDDSSLKHFKNDGSSKKILSPEVSSDLLTDLEKLRFDLLTVISPKAGTSSLPATTVNFIPSSPQKTAFGESLPGKELSFTHSQDFLQFSFDVESFLEELEYSFNKIFSQASKEGQERVILVGAYNKKIDAESSIEELGDLAITADLKVVDTIIQKRNKLDPKTLVGKGKLESIVLHALDLGVDLLVFDRELTPGQLRSITNLTELRVIDRSMLILDIFASRAVSSEGRLQVELAQLKYSLPRLTETDTGLSRLTGGIGGRGPGETKLEIGRRRARKRIADLDKKLKQVSRQRGLRRSRRKERGVPVVALVGYTNAGKSTFLNTITSSEVFVESKLFATLDPTTRRMRFPNEREVVFVDTVGFIRELPKELVTAFKATLEEVGEADILIHLVDSSSEKIEEKINVVENTLSELGYGEKPGFLVFNKIDILSSFEQRSISQKFGGIFVSAKSRKGVAEFIVGVQEALEKTFKGLDPGSFISDKRNNI